MKILADESVDRDVFVRLRADGFDVLAVAELSPSLPDESVLAIANSETAVLLTHDKDFGELSFRLGRVHTGIVLSRLGGLSMDQKVEIVSQAFREHSEEFVGAFSVISPGAVRIRRIRS